MTIQERSIASYQPVFTTSLFDHNKDAKFWVGDISCLDERDIVYDAIGKLRANVYINEMQFLPPDTLDNEGREYDEFDNRSVQFVTLENITDESYRDLPNTRLIGCGRLIFKNFEEEYLPIERQFSELFDKNPAPVGSGEVSRFIARHEDSAIQHLVGVAIIRAMTYYGLEKNTDTGYFEIEKQLLRLLKAIKLPLEQLGVAKDVLEPGGLRQLYPIKINPQTIMSSANSDPSRSLGKLFNGGKNNSISDLYGVNLIDAVHE